jgi:hypothetical protein
MEIRLVAPSVWKPDIARNEHRSASRRLSAETSGLAHAVLWALQDVHVGITPRLATELARLFTEPGAVQQGVWAKLLRRLQETLPRTARSGLVAGNVPVYIALKIVKPVVWESCRRLGYACLLCQDETADGVTIDEYSTYAAGLERELARASEQLSSGPLFALQHGNVVAALSEPSPLGRARASVPEVDQTSLAMLLGLKADVDVPSRAARFRPAPGYVPRSRPSPGDQAGRIEGLRQSRGEAHFGSMILSEFLNHPVVLVDRLLNSGYLVHERRPRREKLRDVLVVGLMPDAVRATVQGSFAKACWLDCMARLGRLLSEARLRDSEFRWIEGDARDRARCCSFSLGELPPEVVATPQHESFRSAFLTLLRWLPDYFDTRSGFRSLGIDPSASADRWAVAAWAAHAGHAHAVPAPPSASSTSQPAPMERFSFVHIMVFHPSIGRGPAARSDGARRLGALRAGLRLGYHARRHASVTYVSSDHEPAAWHFGTDSDPHRSLVSPSLEEGAALARQLQTAWLDRLTKDIWHA